MTAFRKLVSGAVRLAGRGITPVRRRLPPTRVVRVKDLEDRDNKVVHVYSERKHRPHDPIRCSDELHPIFKEHQVWNQPEATVTRLKNGRVWGRRGCILTAEDELVHEPSREFGAYKGVRGQQHPIFQQIILPRASQVDGAVAFIATAGASNFHHWMFDTLPRLHLLKEAGEDLQSSQIIADYTNKSFQCESLKALGVKAENLILPDSQWNFHLQARELVVPSLPSELGTVSDWVISFLRSIFLRPGYSSVVPSRRIYVSRQRAPSRRLSNVNAVESLLFSLGFQEVFAEDLPVYETAKLFSEAEIVVSVHGSGLSNLIFASQNVRVIDLLPPAHLDSYYWIMTDQVGGRYAYMFGEGDVETGDLVSDKVDHDLTVDVAKLQALLCSLL